MLKKLFAIQLSHLLIYMQKCIFVCLFRCFVWLEWSHQVNEWPIEKKKRSERTEENKSDCVYSLCSNDHFRAFILQTKPKKKRKHIHQRQRTTTMAAIKFYLYFVIFNEAKFAYLLSDKWRCSHYWVISMEEMPSFFVSYILLFFCGIQVKKRKKSQKKKKKLRISKE